MRDFVADDFDARKRGKKVEKGKRKGKYRKNEVHIMVKKRKGIEMRSDF